MISKPHDGDVIADAENMTQLLRAVERGEPDAMNRLFDVVYVDLRRLARAHRRRSDAAMSTTTLVHEAYLKLARSSRLNCTDRVHFFATAARVIRHVLANDLKRRHAAKRGGPHRPLPFDDRLIASDAMSEEALAIHQALTRLESDRPRIGRVLECRIFGGMTVQETAEALSISPATVKRDWSAGTAWLFAELEIGI